MVERLVDEFLMERFWDGVVRMLLSMYSWFGYHSIKDETKKSQSG